MQLKLGCYLFKTHCYNYTMFDVSLLVSACMHVHTHTQHKADTKKMRRN